MRNCKPRTPNQAVFMECVKAQKAFLDYLSQEHIQAEEVTLHTFMQASMAILLKQGDKPFNMNHLLSALTTDEYEADTLDKLYNRWLTFMVEYGKVKALGGKSYRLTS